MMQKLVRLAKLPGYLRRNAIVGMNQRNGRYIFSYNPRRLYPLVDDKILTKKLAQDADIAVPEMYGVIDIEHDIKRLPDIVQRYEDFVIKPAQGSRGNGILVIQGKSRGGYLLANGAMMSDADVEHHISNIINGLYSLGGVTDRALIEARVRFDPVFHDVSYRGVPDVRTIVFRGLPVAAMLRLPTRAAGGKANLHQGAVGTGIDLSTGLTTRSVWNGQYVDEHPDTHTGIAGRRIPHWEDVLVLAARCGELADLGFLGVDIVLDSVHGPMMLELNARPGLAIQLANGFGLRQRLQQVEALDDIPTDAIGRARLARDMFTQGESLERSL
ncbi:MAG: alpha-L-glutamate ligase-like protein [Gammaproteobacteria bacterium]